MKNEIKYFPIINRSDSCKVKVSDICYITRDDRKLLFDTEHGLKTTYGKISTVERYLGPDFVRCMSGCIVNLSKVRETKDMVVYFDNGKELKLGRTGYVHLKQKFNTYLRKMAPWESEEDGENSKQDSEQGDS